MGCCWSFVWSPMLLILPRSPLLLLRCWEQAACICKRWVGVSLISLKCLHTSWYHWLTCANSSLIPMCLWVKGRRGNNSMRCYWCYHLKLGSRMSENENTKKFRVQARSVWSWWTTSLPCIFTCCIWKLMWDSHYPILALFSVGLKNVSLLVR